MRILFIHGRAQGGKDPEKLNNVWIDTLKKGFQACGKTLPENIEIDFPFYGDKLDELTAKAKLDDPNGLKSKGGGKNKEYQNFMKLALAEIKERKGITDDQIDTEYKGSGTEKKGIQNWGWVQAIASYLDKNYENFSEFTIEQFLTDVYLYVNTPAVTKSINKIVEEKLTDEPTIIVSHSLGTVVAYKVIMEHLDHLNLHKFITIGSPLGIKSINAKLGKPVNPGAEDDWFNAYDERDIVALNPLDKTYFPTVPQISNYNGVDNHTDNRHGIIGYLNNQTIAGEIVSALEEEVDDSEI